MSCHHCFVVSVSTVMGCMENLGASIVDEYPSMRQYKPAIVFTIMSGIFMINLVMATKGIFSLIEIKTVDEIFNLICMPHVLYRLTFIFLIFRWNTCLLLVVIVLHILAFIILWFVDSRWSCLLSWWKIFDERSWRHVKDAIDSLHLRSYICPLHLHHSSSNGCK